MALTVPISEIVDHIGEETGVGEWSVMGQDRINQFADVTEDWQYIHVDEEKAKDSMFGGTIAHGFLTLSMLVKMSQGALIEIEGVETVINYGFEKIRFLAPVPSGSKIRARVVLKDAVIKGAGKRALVTNEITVEIDGGKRPALVAEWIFMAVTAPVGK